MWCPLRLGIMLCLWILFIQKILFIYPILISLKHIGHIFGVYLIRSCNFILLNRWKSFLLFLLSFGAISPGHIHSNKDILRYYILWHSFPVLLGQGHHDQRKSNRSLSLIKRIFQEILFQLTKKIMSCTVFIFHS